MLVATTGAPNGSGWWWSGAAAVWGANGSDAEKDAGISTSELVASVIVVEGGGAVVAAGLSAPDKLSMPRDCCRECCVMNGGEVDGATGAAVADAAEAGVGAEPCGA